MASRVSRGYSLLLLITSLGSVAVCWAAAPHKPVHAPTHHPTKKPSAKHHPTPKPHKPKPHKTPTRRTPVRTPHSASPTRPPTTAVTPSPAVAPTPVPQAVPVLPALAARTQLCQALGQHVADLSAIDNSLTNRLPASNGFPFSPDVDPKDSAFYYFYRFEALVTPTAHERDPTRADTVTYDTRNISILDQPKMQSAAVQYFTAVCSVNASCAKFFTDSGLDVGDSVGGLYGSNLAQIKQMLLAPGTVAQASNFHDATPLAALAKLPTCDAEYMGIHDWCSYLPGMTLKEVRIINLVSTVLNANLGKRAAAVEYFVFSVMMAKCYGDTLPAKRVGVTAAHQSLAVDVVRGPAPLQSPCQPHNYTCMVRDKIATGRIDAVHLDAMLAEDLCQQNIMKLGQGYSLAQQGCAVAGITSFANVGNVLGFIKAGQAGTGSFLLSTGYNWFNLILATASENLPKGTLWDAAVEFNDLTSLAAAVESLFTLAALTGSPYGALLALPGLLCAVFNLGVDTYNAAASRCASFCTFSQCILCAIGCCSAGLLDLSGAIA